MDAAAARATGLFVESPPPQSDACVSWSTARATPVDVVVSPTLGVAALVVKEDAAAVRTPEGIGIGSTAKQVHTAYPAFDVANYDAPNGPLVEVPGNADANYRLQFDDAGVVQTLNLELVDQNCYA